jgi:predicted metalloprotease
MWARFATRTPHPTTGRPLIRTLTDQDIAAGLDAASRVGDDFIQREFQGEVRPEQWTHGSSAQRQRWFTTGMQSDNIESCDTFAARDL